MSVAKPFPGMSVAKPFPGMSVAKPFSGMSVAKPFPGMSFPGMSVVPEDIELKTFINMTLELVNKIKDSLLYNRFVYDKQKNKFLFNEIEKLEITLSQQFKDFHKDLWNTCPCCYGQGFPLQCQHVICIPCLSKLKQKSCPMCREKIILDIDMHMDMDANIDMDDHTDIHMDVMDVDDDAARM
jgi:hypothetical protein